jgi:hypothetical protein
MQHDITKTVKTTLILLPNLPAASICDLRSFAIFARPKHKISDD